MKAPRGQPLNCAICGGMYTLTSRTGIQRERAYAVHQASDRHHDAVKALLDEDGGGLALAMAWTEEERAQEHAARDAYNA